MEWMEEVWVEVWVEWLRREVCEACLDACNGNGTRIDEDGLGRSASLAVLILSWLPVKGPHASLRD